MLILEKTDDTGTRLICGGSLNNLIAYANGLISSESVSYDNRFWEYKGGLHERISTIGCYTIRAIPILKSMPVLVTPE